MTWNRAVRILNTTVFMLGLLAVLGIAGWIEGLQ